MLKKILFITLLFTVNAHSADYLDTQYGDDGLEVHVMKATTSKNILTIVFAVENTNDTESTYMAFPIPQVFYNTENKKYPVLQDADNKWLASTIGYSASDYAIFLSSNYFHKNHIFTLKAGKKKVGWVKFEAPSEDGWPLDLSFPGVTPFSIPKPQ